MFSPLLVRLGIASGDMKTIDTRGYTQRNTDQVLKEKMDTIHGRRKCSRANRLFACGVGSRDSKFGAC